MDANSRKTLVVGTTSDYIEWIRQTRTERALFLTDPENRQHATEPLPEPREEVVVELDDFGRVRKSLAAHLAKWHLSLDGIVAFDCESLELASRLANDYGLVYPSVESIRTCRDKYACKTLWHRNGVRCPRSVLVQSADGVYDFMEELGQACVIKPLTGSGSELVFRCVSRKDCDKWVHILKNELNGRMFNRLYKGETTWFLAEEFVCGKEFSCDFRVLDDKVQIVRITEKIHAYNQLFGTIAGYALHGEPIADFPLALLEETLGRAAAALGVGRTVCMVDFLWADGEIVLLEMTPRPGGDCLPQLLRRARGLDMLGLALDAAGQKPLVFPAGGDGRTYVGLRLHAGKAGEIRTLDSSRLVADERVREIRLLREPGHRITLPPDDYESWYLGHVIFEADPGQALDAQCRDLTRLLTIETEELAERRRAGKRGKRRK